MIKLQSILSYILLGILALVVILMSACSIANTTRHIHTTMRSVSIENASSLKTSRNEFEKMVYNPSIRSRIMDQFTHWKGVRYRFGGSTKKGIDCSAFVQRTFREQFGLELPRSTYKQQETGKSISRSDLRTGDLVLFRAGSTGRHIGIYIGSNQFVHVSTSSGVIISNLNDPYWKKHYSKARRVLTRS